MENTTIVSERNRPLWKLILAAFCFAVSTTLIGTFILQFFASNELISILAKQSFYCFYLIPIGIGLCSHKRIYIDLERSKFKSSTEIGPLRFGRWQTIKNYEYVSVFYQLRSNGSPKFEVNLWCDNNRHFELYARDNYVDAFTIAYHLSEELDVDLLDATVPNDHKWIDKSHWKEQIEKNAS